MTPCSWQEVKIQEQVTHHLHATLIQGAGSVADALARLKEGLYAGVVFEALELQVGTHVGVGVV